MINFILTFSNMHIIYFNQSHSSLITHTYIYALITFKETPGTALIKKKFLSVVTGIQS